MKVTRGMGIAGAVVLIAIAFVAFDYFQHRGLFKTLKPHFGGTCTTIPLSASAEDIRIDPRRGVAFLATLDRRAQAEGKEVRGSITLLDLNVAEPRARAALSSEPANFRPLGLSLYASSQGPRRLLVLSALGGEQRSVEIFEETATGAFAPVETIRDALLVHADAIAAVGPRQFYVANFSGASNGFERLQERLFRRGRSSITYFDGEGLRAVAEGLKRAGGIAVSNHGLWVYVGETDANQLRVFDRDSATGSLEPRNIVELGSAPQNVTIDSEGTVWVAAHPKLLALKAHLRDPSEASPTAIYRLRTSVAEKEDRLTIPYLDLGERISAGSVAAVHGRRMLVGSLTEHKVLFCELPENL